MNILLLTQDSGFLKPIIWVLGKIMNVIFMGIDAIGIPNVGLAIILFTIVVNLLMLPLTIKQQKFSKLSAKIQPEVQEIQAKYKNRKDQNSQMMMSQEIQMVYAKYGVSQTGGCLYLLIQMPILFSLYRIIVSMPAYVTKIGDTFRVLAQKVIDVDPNCDFMRNAESSSQSIANTFAMYGRHITEGGDNLNGVVDVLNKLSTADMGIVAQHYGLSDLTSNGQLILSNGTTKGLIDTYNNFLGLNVGNSPQYIMSEAIKAGAWLLVAGAIFLPILCMVTQWLNSKLMPQATSNDPQTSSVNSSMKTMNIIMPIISGWFCFTWASGMGIYWAAGSIVRIIQQIAINKHIDKIDFDELIEKNAEKSKLKMEKIKQNQERLNEYAKMNTKNIQSTVPNNKSVTKKATSYNNKASDSDSNVESSTSSNAKASQAGSMFEKANRVKQYNEKNNR